jgi:hypothetical protein
MFFKIIDFEYPARFFLKSPSYAPSNKAPSTRSTLTEAAAASAASAAARPRLLQARGMRPSTRPETRNSPKSFTWRLKPPLFLPAASPYHEVLAVAQLDKADAACAEADAACLGEEFCHAAPRLYLLRPLPHLTHLSLYVQELRQNLWVERRRGTRRQQRTRLRRGGRRRHGHSVARDHRARI